MATDTLEFNSYVVEEINGKFEGAIKTQTLDDLPQHDCLVQVCFSALNYKDALSASGNKGVTKNYPHTPGIDAAGKIIRCESGHFKEGDSVIITGYDFGMNTAGGFGQYVRVPSEWCVKLPESLLMQEAMILGTGGLTAAMSVLKLIEQVNPQDGDVVVSGATGGVGSLSVAILAKLGFKVCGISGKKKGSDFLMQLGASEIIDRESFAQENPRPMLKSRFAGGIDTVGGSVLENIIKSTQALGTVTCCGNVASPKLDLTVFPFILRGISLIGIDSQNAPLAFRETLWEKLANEWRIDHLERLAKTITLNELSDHIQLMLDGKIRGRTIIDLEAN